MSRKKNKERIAAREKRREARPVDDTPAPLYVPESEPNRIRGTLSTSASDKLFRVLRMIFGKRERK
jgi:hypothetical protein